VSLPSDVERRRAQDLDELTERVPPARRRAIGSLGPAPTDAFRDLSFATLGDIDIVAERFCLRHAFPASACPGCAVELAMLSEPRP
jgi:hypothetical protein